MPEEQQINPDQKRYDLLGEVIHDLEKDLIKAEISEVGIKRQMAAMTIKGQQPNQNQLMAVAMNRAEMQSLPKMIEAAKELRFAAYEKLKKAGQDPLEIKLPPPDPGEMVTKAG